MKSLILNSVGLFFFAQALAGAEGALTCEKGMIRVAGEKAPAVAAEYCSNSAGNILLSKDCQNLGCEAFKKERPKGSFGGPLGKPGFSLCRALGGEPQLIEFTFRKKIESLDRCKFSAKSFADTGSLYKFYVIDPPSP